MLLNDGLLAHVLTAAAYVQAVPGLAARVQLKLLKSVTTEGVTAFTA
jgi:hypothetical protein